MKSIAIITLLALTGCASITNGTTQQVTFPVPEGQECIVTRPDGLQMQVKAESPTVKVRRSREALTLDCGEQKQVYESSINAAGYTSILWVDFGIVDFMTGALWEYTDASTK